MSNIFDEIERLPNRISSKAAAAMLRVSERTLFNWRKAGVGPPYVRIGLKRIMYDETALHDWAGSSSAQRPARCPCCGAWTSPSQDGDQGGHGHG